MGDGGGHFVWDMQPEVFSFMPLPRWYGLLFVLGFAGGYAWVRHIYWREGKPTDDLDRLLTYLVVGTVVGMRLGHCLFYEPDVYLRQPWRIPMFWEGGYASHGGMIGVIVALAIYAVRTPQSPFFWITDRVCGPTLFAAGCIRIGNFFNSEMIGPPSMVPWAIVFKQVDATPRHPAQLYEAIGYLSVSLIAWLLYRYTGITKTRGRLFGVVVILGFTWRFLMEFFKENQVAFEEGLPLNMGQLLSLPFVAIGVLLVAGTLQKALPKSWGETA